MSNTQQDSNETHTEISDNNVDQPADPHQEETHEVREITVEALHGIADVVTTLHSGGIHLPPAANRIGIAAAIGSEIFHNSTENLTERLVCGVVIGAAIETVNMTIATGAGMAAGTAASTASTPLGGAAVAGGVAIAAHQMMERISEPVRQLAENACHTGFEWGRTQLAELASQENQPSSADNAESTHIANVNILAPTNLVEQKIQQELTRLEESMTKDMMACNDGTTRHIDTVQYAGLAVIKGWLSGHPLSHHLLSKELVTEARNRHPSLVHYIALRLLQERAEAGLTDALDYAAQWDLFEAMYQAERINWLTDSNKASAMQHALTSNSVRTMVFLSRDKIQRELARLEESMTKDMMACNDGTTRHIDTVQYAGLAVIKGWLSGHPLSHHLLDKELVDAARNRHPSLVHYIALRLLQERAEAGFTNALDFAAQWDLFEAFDQAGRLNWLTDGNKASAMQKAADYRSHLTINFLKDLGVTVPQSYYVNHNVSSTNHNVSSNSNGFFAQSNGGREETSRGKSSSRVYDGRLFNDNSSRSCPAGTEKVTSANGRSGCLGFRF